MGYAQPPTITTEVGYRVALRRVFGSPAFKHARALTLLAWSADEASLLMLDHGARGCLERWDARTGTLLATTEVSPRPAKEGHAIGAAHAIVRASQGRASVMEVWDLAAARLLDVLPADDGARGLAVSPAAWVVVVNDGQWANARALPSGERLGSAPGEALAVSPDGSMFVAPAPHGYRALLLVWWVDGTRITDIDCRPGDRWGPRAVFSRDGRAVVVGAEDGSVHCYELATRDLRWANEKERDDGRTGRSRVYALALSPGGATCYALRGGRVLDAIAPDGRLRWSVALKANASWKDGAQIVPAPSGALVAVNEPDGALRVFDAATGAERSTIGGHHRRVVRLAVSPDGRLVASSAGRRLREGRRRDRGRHALGVGGPPPPTNRAGSGCTRSSSRATGVHCGPPRACAGRSAGTSPAASRRAASSPRSAPAGPAARPTARGCSSGAAGTCNAGAIASRASPSGTRPPPPESREARPRPTDVWCEAAAFGPDASWVVAVWGRGTVSTVETLDARTGEALAAPRDVARPLRRAAETDEGPVSIAAVDDALVLIEEWGERHERIVPAAKRYFRHACLSADRRWLVVGNRDDVAAWDLSAWPARLAGRVDLAPLDDALTALALSAYGDLIAVGTRRGCVLTFALGADVP